MPPGSVPRRYRPEIDGLRAVALLAVMLFHAGFETFAGGYVGVDIFFVISGFLITGILLDELRSGRFSFADFIERRARRILPALFVVLLACLPLAWQWSMPIEMRDFSAALLSVIGFVSNIWFWRSNGYFDFQADINPLLHTWSLAVEEQYYLLFPLLLGLLWRFRRSAPVVAFVLAGVVSLVLAQWGAHHEPTANFYLLPTRGWEFLIGALLAAAPSEPAHRVSARVGQALALVGAALIGYAVLRYDAHTPFPGLAALLPTLGAALLIRHASASTWVGRLLASRLLVGIGLVSYSAYLWHQPLFAFVRQRNLERPQAPLLLALMALAFALAWLSWKQVETPWRDRRRTPRRWLVVGAIACTAALGVFGVAGVLSNGYPARLAAPERELMAYAAYDFKAVYRDAECVLRTEQSWRDFAADCAAADPAATLVWGDSHAAALSHGLRQVGGDLHQYTASGCPPLVDVHRLSFPNCAAVNAHVLAEIARLKPRRIVLHANWLLHADLQPDTAAAGHVRPHRRGVTGQRGDDRRPGPAVVPRAAIGDAQARDGAAAGPVPRDAGTCRTRRVRPRAASSGAARRRRVQIGTPGAVRRRALSGDAARPGADHPDGLGLRAPDGGRLGRTGATPGPVRLRRNAPEFSRRCRRHRAELIPAARPAGLGTAGREFWQAPGNWRLLRQSQGRLCLSGFSLADHASLEGTSQRRPLVPAAVPQPCRF